MADLIAHKAVELDKVKVARRRVLSSPGYLDANYMAQPKHDGCFGAVVAAEQALYSRTGEETRSMRHLAVEVSRVFGDDVVFGEVWNRGIGQSEISGAFRQHNPAPWLEFVVFDCIPRAAYNAEYCDEPYKARLFRLECAISRANTTIHAVSTFNQGTYGKHEALRDDFLARGGYDGLILRDPEAPWIMGNGTGGEIIKSKRVLSFDLEVLAVKEGKGKLLGHAGALALRWKDGRTIEAIGGSYADRKDWLTNPSGIVGKIVEVEAMDYSADGLLREPRVKGIRFDKERADF